MRHTLNVLSQHAVGALLFALAATTPGCDSKPAGTDTTAAADSLSNQKLDQLIQSTEELLVTVPSPLDIANLIKKSGARFDAGQALNPSDHSKYNTSFKQAVNMGMFTADLGYVTYYKETQRTQEYLNSIHKLGSKLQVAGAFELTLLERAKLNLDKQDSLLYMITEQSNNARDYLRQQERPEVAALIIAGGWLEGLHLACQIQRTNPSEAIKNRIGENRLALNSLLQIMDKYQNDAEIKQFYTELLALADTYKDVKIDYATNPAAGPKQVSADGVVSYTTQQTSTVTMSPETLKAITEKVAALRKNLAS